MIWSYDAPTFGFFWVFMFPLMIVIGLGVIWSVLSAIWGAGSTLFVLRHRL
jgi:hypothetical protein